MTEIWSSFRNFIYFMQVNRNAGFMGNCRQMQHCIGRTAQGHVSSKTIPEIFSSHHLTGSNSLLIQIHYSHAGMLCKSNTFTSNCRNCSIARQTESQNLCQTVHGICSEHSRTGTTARTGSMLHIFQLTFSNFANCKGTNSLKHICQRKFLSIIGIRRIHNMPRHHRSARTENSRQIQAGSSHKHARNNLVAVRNHYKGIKLMSFCNTFNGISNKFTRYQRIFHSFMPHGNAVANTNCRKFYRSTAAHSHASFYSFGNSVKFNMSWNKFIFSTNNAH